MNISLDIWVEVSFTTQIGNVVIDNHVDLLNIDTPRDDVRGDQNFRLAISESVEDGISVGGELLAM